MALTLIEPLQPFFRSFAYGVALRLVPGKDASSTFWRYGFEVQRAPDSAGSPGTPEDIFRSTQPLPSAGGVFVDLLPSALTYYHYRWRHIGPGFNPGPYSAYVKRAADQVPQEILSAAINQPNVYPLMRSEPRDDGKYDLRAEDAAGFVAQDVGATLVADFSNAVVTVTDGQASPKIRTKYGKVGAGLADYGLQVFDMAGATVADFTGSKRILAVPVRPSADSGASITLDLSTGLTRQVRLTNSAATIRLQNPTNGGRYRIWFQQDATGSRAFPTIVDDASGMENVMYTNDTKPVLTTTPGAMDLFELEYRTSPSARYTCMTLQTNILLPTPQVQSLTESTFASDTTTHNVSMPGAVSSGDLLLIIFVADAAPVVTTPSGWTALATFTHVTKCVVFGKVASGSEGGTAVDVVTDTSEKAAAQVFRITRWSGELSGVEVGTSFADSGTSDINPPSLSPTWNVDRNLWIAVGGWGNALRTISLYPVNYTNGVDTNAGSDTTGAALASARRSLYATSEDPGTMTLSAADSWYGFTIAVRPPV